MVDELKDELSCVKLPVIWLSVIMFVLPNPKMDFLGDLFLMMIRNVKMPLVSPKYKYKTH